MEQKKINKPTYVVRNYFSEVTTPKQTFSDMRKQYKLSKCETYLIEDGEINEAEAIELHRDSCDINNHIAVSNGKYVPLHAQEELVYGDFTEHPKTLAEAHKAIKLARKITEANEKLIKEAGEKELAKQADLKAQEEQKQANEGKDNNKTSENKEGGEK